MERFFTFRGRMSRQAFWRTSRVLLFAFSTAWCLGLFAILAFGPAAGVILAIAVPAYLLASVSCCVRRLHDRGKSGWWLAPMIAGPFAAAALSHRLMHSHSFPATWAGATLALAGLCALYWAWTEIGFLQGRPQPASQG